MATIQTSFLAAAYGKETVILKDVMPYLIHRIDPAQAVKMYYHSYRPRSKDEELRANYKPRNPLNLNEQIRYGQYRIVMHMLQAGKRTGMFGYTYSKEVGYPNLEITILESGKKLQRGMGVWKEICRGVQQGLLTINLEIAKEQITPFSV